MHVVRWLVAVLLAGSITAPARAQADAPVPQGTQGTQGTGAGSAVAPLRRTVTLALRGVPLVQAIQAIDQQADLRLAYTDRLPNLDKHVTIVATGMPAGEALARVLEGSGIEVRVTKKGQITLVRAERKRGQATMADSAFGDVWGRVTDSVTARPIEGARVNVEGTALTTATNDSGYFWFNRVPAGPRALVVRMIGYRAATHVVGVISGPNASVRQDFALTMSMSQLQQVVVTATGPQRRMEIANDITVLDVDSIAATQPIRSVSDLLVNRVPELTAIRSSGAPGDPIRFRLRGAHSALLNNDPIVIVDGVRVYAQQSADRSRNLALRNPQGYAPPAPSLLDQIDPNSIQTIEVVKGASAATLYGQDAANGVIVITTKHGRAGPARWTAHVDYGQTSQPGSYPVGYFRWGHPVAQSDPWQLCALRNQQCVTDSVTHFQLLNDPRYSVLGNGERTAGTVGVSGGVASLTYDVSGSLSDETGLLTLPNMEVERFRNRVGSAPPDWMVHPHHFREWSANTGLGMELGKKANVRLQAMLSRSDQQRSDLEGQLGALMRTYYDSASGLTWQANGNSISQLTSGTPFSGFYQHVTSQQTTFTNGVNLEWRPLSWLTAHGDAGISYNARDDHVVVPRGYVPSGADTVGMVSLNQSTTLTRTVTLRATAIAPLPLGLQLRTSVGANFVGTGALDFTNSGHDLAPGETSLGSAKYPDSPLEVRSDLSTFGWFVEPTISHKRFTLSTGLRLDGGSTYGTHVKLPTFPRLGFSYLVSDEPFFPFKNVINSFRLRVSYGEAGRVPEPAEKLRLYQQVQVWTDSELVTGTGVSTLGNTQLKPERTKEFEAGFDADLLDDRISIYFTGHHNTTVDAIEEVPVPPSVYDVSSVLKNVGVIRNTGFALTLGLEPVRSDALIWSLNGFMTVNHNRVVSLSSGVSPFFNATGDGRVAAGYPLFGRWARPIIGYEDVNHDGIIEGSEVQVGDSLVYMGQPDPNFEASFGTTLSLFRGRLSVDASFAYEGGKTQINRTALDNQIFSQALNDPNAPLGQQAAVAAMDRTLYGEMQTVSTLRFNSLSITYAVPRIVALRLGAKDVRVSLQGTNLGLFTNYRGKDPDVNAYATGNGVIDTGVLPQPRTWSMRVSATY
ncbi:MAG TPA: TonB-dependent receptor [Gemmatimonadaceae bacterium]|nr:TonB-dependent receptor [Gemmatimonadaceae bacterium]